MFYPVKTPFFIKKLYPRYTWTLPVTGKALFLTFDDGPHPLVTPFVLEELAKWKARATFFCIGKNVRAHFDTYRRLIEEGHRVGNHTFNHLDGWKTDDRTYLEDVREAARIIDSTLFRPPYGRITRFQQRLLRGEATGLKTIMWDVLSGDFDHGIKPGECYLNVVKNAAPGSIVVFHDSEKARERLEYTLPRVLGYFAEKGFRFDGIPG